MGEGEEVLTETSGQSLNNGSTGWTVQIGRESSSTGQTTKLKTLITQLVCGWIKAEVIALVKLSVPIILTLVFQNLLIFVSLIFVGHISNRSLEIDSAALSSSFANITGISVGIGLSSAADTLCSQTFGYKNFKRVGHIFQRGLLILCLLSLFVCVIWLNTESILLLLQQSPCVARYSGTYVQIFTLSLPPFFLYWMLQKYLQAQSIVWPFILTGALTNVANAIFHAIFVIWADLGVNGASLSMVLSYYCFPLFLIIYIRLRKLHEQTWDGWSWESLKGWGQFLKLGLPGVAMTCLEWVSYEIAAFVLGSISEVELAANSIMVNVIILLFMIPLGISIASGVRVGNELGAGNPRQAKRATYVSMGVVFINIIFQVIFLQSTKSVFGLMYTRNREVLERIPQLVNVISILLFADQLQLSLRGVILGCGQQLFASVINFIAFYIIGLPLGISLALLTNLGSVGMWAGLTCAAYFQAFCLLVFLFRLDWKKESEKAIIRSRGDDEKPEKVKDEKEESISIESDEVRLLNVTSNDESTVQELVELDELLSSVNEEQEVEENTLEDISDSQELLTTMTPVPAGRTRSHIKLLLCRGSVVLIALVLIVIAGIASQYHPTSDSIINGNYSECSDDDIDIFPAPSSVSLLSSTAAFY